MTELPKYILAIDPGGTTGMALIATEPLEIVWTAEVPTWVETARKVDETLREYGEDVDVVAEKFTITAQTAKKSPQPTALYIIGMTMLLLMAHTKRELVLQKPADAKNFASNARLKQLGLWHVGGGGHALDALRHAVLRLVNLGWKDSRLLIRD